MLQDLLPQLLSWRCCCSHCYCLQLPDLLPLQLLLLLLPALLLLLQQTLRLSRCC
jgi:hypothetical protein